MPHRRFKLRLHHSDTALLLLAVLVATAFCWVVVVFSQGDRSRPAVAHKIEAPGLTLSGPAASRLLQETLRDQKGVTATLVRDSQGVSISLVSRQTGPQEAAAGKLAEALATRLRQTAWSASDTDLADELADRLYQLDVRLRDASARRKSAATVGEKAGLAASLEVSRLLRRRGELLARQKATLIGGETPTVTVSNHKRPSLASTERHAASLLFGVLVSAAAYRFLLGRTAQNAAVAGTLSTHVETVRLPRRWKRLARWSSVEHAREQPRAA